MNESNNFYRNLKPFSDFKSFTDEAHYKVLPEDWLILITDIKGSTKAVEAGRYKDVNLIGAACITTAINTFGDQEFPFVFGGDGASLCIPKDKEELVGSEMAKLIQLAKKNFGLDLRVAKIPASKIYEAGKSIWVSKYEITAKSHMALFRGGGLAYADKLAKDFYDEYKITPSNNLLDELVGVSCRWKPIAPSKECVLSLLVCTQKDVGQSEIYQEVMSNISKILDSTIEEANPVLSQSKSYKGFFQSLKDESAFHGSIFSPKFLLRFIEIVISTLIFKYKFNPLFFIYSFKPYYQSMSSHSDFRRFDDTLRLVLDCTQKQVDSLTEYLNDSYQKGLVYYGIFVSKEALMTCYVKDLNEGNHLHFVDGGDGGLTKAAKAMKAQQKLKELST